MLRIGKWIIILLSVGTVVGGFSALAVWLEHSERFPLRVVEIRDDLKKIKPEEVTQTLASYLGQGFFGLEMEGIQKKLTDLPWASKVSVRRIWPDKIAISIKERIPQALWEEKGVLSTEGVVFFPDLATLPRDLPRFRGPIQRAKEIQQHYFSLLEMMGPLGISISELHLLPDGTWQMNLGNGIAIILGKTAFNERVTRLVLAYRGIQDKLNRIAYLDLRYTNGLAIGWKGERE